MRVDSLYEIGPSISFKLLLLQVLYEYIFMKYALDVPFAIFRQVPRQLISHQDTATIGSLEGVALAVEESTTSDEDPLAYLMQYKVSTIACT